MFVLSFADMLAATAATGSKTAIGIEWIVEGRHGDLLPRTLPPN
jgi:hypothetical protein